MSAYDDRVHELYRLPKAKLAELYDSRHTFVYLAAPLTQWSKDELISAILQDEFPQGRPVSATAVEEPQASCNCASKGNAATCPLHTQEDFDAADRVRAAAAKDEHFPWHYTEFGVVCACGASMDADEKCAALRSAVSS